MDDQEWTMPHIEVGDYVFYMKYPDDPGLLAICTGVAPNGIKCVIIGSGLERKVTHVDDPILKKFPMRGDSGLFRLAKSTERVNELERKVASLERKLDSLKSKQPIKEMARV